MVLIITFVLLASSCAVKSKSEVGFANKLAAEGLWKEALFRWQKVLEQGKESGAIYNNIAVAYERLGDNEKAETHYKKALELSPGNGRIKENYRLFQNNLKGMEKKDDK